MCDKLEHPRDCHRSGRRNFVKVAVAATALGVTGGGLFTGPARADALTLVWPYAPSSSRRTVGIMRMPTPRLANTPLFSEAPPVSPDPVTEVSFGDRSPRFPVT